MDKETFKNYMITAKNIGGDYSTGYRRGLKVHSMKNMRL